MIESTAEPVTRAMGGEPATPPPLAVLLASDDSASARVGEEWIRRLRWATAPRVDVVTVAGDPPPLWGLGLQTYRAVVRQAVADSRQERLTAALRIANDVGARLQAGGFGVRVWARHGTAADEILTVARLERPDLLVVSPRDRSTHARAWHLGTARRLVCDADLPVLVARAVGDAVALPQHVLVIGNAQDSRHVIEWMSHAGWLGAAKVLFAGFGEGSTDAMVSLVSELNAQAGGSGRARFSLAGEIESAVDARKLAQSTRTDVIAAANRGADVRPADAAEQAGQQAAASVLLVPRPVRRPDYGQQVAGRGSADR